MRRTPLLLLPALLALLVALAPAPGTAAVPPARTPAAAPEGTPPRYAPDPPAKIDCRPGGKRVSLRCEIGRSVRGRPIVAKRQGPADAARVLLVSGQMHGDEWPGPKVVRTIRRLAVPGGVQVWTVATMNPDGRALHQRHNARGVDLNRNFGARWRPLPHAGSRPWSEPASRAMRRLLRWVQPDAIVSLHGFSESVDTTGGGARARLAREFSRLSGVGPAQPVPCGGPCHGNMTEWYTRISTVGGAAFTVEMPRTSRRDRACPVRDGRRIPVIRCAARAAVKLATTL